MIDGEAIRSDSDVDQTKLLSNWVQGKLWAIKGNLIRAEIFFEICNDFFNSGKQDHCIPLLCAPSLGPVSLTSLLQESGLASLHLKEEFHRIITICNEKEYPSHVSELYFLLNAQFHCKESISIGDVLQCATALFRIVLPDPVSDLSWIDGSEAILNLLQDVADYLYEIDPLQSPATHNRSLTDFLQVLVSMLKGFEKKGELKQHGQSRLFGQVCTCAFLILCHCNASEKDLCAAINSVHRELMNIGDCRPQGERAQEPGFIYKSLRFLDRFYAEQLQPLDGGQELKKAVNLLLECQFGFKIKGSTTTHPRDCDDESFWMKSFDIIDWVVSRYFLPLYEMDMLLESGGFAVAALEVYKSRLPIIQSDTRVSFEQIRGLKDQLSDALDDSEPLTLEGRASRLLCICDSDEPEVLMKAILLDPTNREARTNLVKDLEKLLPIQQNKLRRDSLLETKRNLQFLYETLADDDEHRIRHGELCYSLVSDAQTPDERNALLKQTIDLLGSEHTPKLLFTKYYLLGKALLNSRPLSLTEDGQSLQVLDALKKAMKKANKNTAYVAYYAFHVARLKIGRQANAAELQLLLGSDVSAKATFDLVRQHAKKPFQKTAEVPLELPESTPLSLFDQLADDVYLAMNACRTGFIWNAHKAVYRAATIALYFNRPVQAVKNFERFWNGNKKKNDFLVPYFPDKSWYIDKGVIFRTLLSLKYAQLWSDALFRQEDSNAVISFKDKFALCFLNELSPKYNLPAVGLFIEQFAAQSARFIRDHPPREEEPKNTPQRLETPPVSLSSPESPILPPLSSSPMPSLDLSQQSLASSSQPPELYFSSIPLFPHEPVSPPTPTRSLVLQPPSQPRLESQEERAMAFFALPEPSG